LYKKLGNPKTALLLVIFCTFLFTISLAFAVQPEINFSLTEQENEIVFDYTASSAGTGIQCLKLEVFHNDDAQELPITNDCTASGKYTFTKQETNDFYTAIKYFDGSGIQTFTSPIQQLQSQQESFPTAENLRFTRNNIPLNAISEGSSFFVSLKFDIGKKQNLNSITADLSGLTVNPAKKQQYKSINVDLDNCRENDQNKYTCSISDLQLQPSSAKVRIVLQFENSQEEKQNTTLEKTFTISNTNPEIVFFGTDKCSEEGDCYVKNGNNKIILQFTGSSAGFSTRQLYYSAGGSASRVSECSDTECSGGLFLECTDGPVNLYTTSLSTNPSQDDAGNLLTGKTSTTIYCDNTKPEIVDLKAESGSGLNFTKSGDQIIVTATVREETKPEIFVNFSDFGEGTVQGECTEKEIYWECTASSTAQPGPYTGTLAVNILDVAGNLATEQKQLDVLAIDTNETPDLWNLGRTNYAPDVFNKKFIPATDNHIYVNLKLEPKKRDVETLRIVPQGCTAMKDFGVNGLIKASGEDVLVTKQRGARDLILKLSLRKSSTDYNNFDELRFVCSLDVYSRWGDIFFNKPQQVNYSLNIKLLETDSVGDNIQNKIKQVGEDIDDQRKKWQKLESYVGYMDPVCRQILPFFSKTSQALDSAAVTLEGIPGMQGAAEGVSHAAAGVDETHGKAKEMPAIGQACRFITCDSSVNKAIPSLMGDLPGVDTMSKIAGYDDASYEDIFDPYKSIYLAWASACLPAVLELQQRHRAVDCEYRRCLSEDVAAGYPISSCDSAKSYATCKYYTGEAFELIPYTALQRRLGDKVKAILSNPASIAGMGLSRLLCGKMHGPIAHAACSIPENIKEIKSYIDLYTDWPTTSTGETDSYCSQIMGNIDEDGYWEPYSKPGEPFYTDRVYPDIVGPLPQGERRTGCTEYGCTFVDENGKQDSDFIVVSYPSGAQRLFYEGEYVGTITTVSDNAIKFQLLNDLPSELDREMSEKILSEERSLIQLSQVSKTYYEEINGPEGVYRTAVAGPHEENLDELEDRLLELQTAKQEYESQKLIVEENNKAIEQIQQEIEQETDISDLDKLRDDLEFHQNFGDQESEKLQDAEKEYTKQKDKYKDQLDKIADDAKYEQNNRQWEGGWNAWSKMLENAMAIDYVTRYIPGFSEWANKWWINNWLKTFFEKDVVQATFGDYEGLICEAKLDKSSQQGQALISTGVFYRPAAHIEAERTMLIDPDHSKQDDEYYNYFVSAGINAKKGGLKFKIFAYGDDKINLTGLETLPENNPRYPIQQGLITFSSEKQYTSVCIEFQHSQGELFEYFDALELKDSKICNEIKIQQ